MLASTQILLKYSARQTSYSVILIVIEVVYFGVDFFDDM